MEFLEHTIAWCKGEILEGRIILVCGIVLFISAFLFYKFGTTNYTKEIILPLLLLGSLFVGSGIYSNVSNEKRIGYFTKLSEISEVQLIKEEKARVENFMTWYPKVKLTMSIIIVLGIVAYIIGGIKIQSFALVFILMGLSGLVIDHFSKQRAQIYYEQIVKHSQGIK